MDRKELVEQILKSRNLQYTVKEGFDEYDKVNFTFYEVINGNRKLGIDIAKEYTIYFMDWHAHYSFDFDGYIEDFKRDLNALLDNKMCAACTYYGEADNLQPGAACSYYDYQLSQEFIEDEFGSDKIVKCYFFDEKLDREFTI